MNPCTRDGYLVGGTHSIPSDPTDLHVESLPVVGCNQLRCAACRAPVRHATALSFASPRDLAAGELEELYATADLTTSPLLNEAYPELRLYLCRCRRWLETSHHACAEPDPDGSDPDMPWHCEGHPAITLPHDLDGTIITAENLADVIARGFHGDAPPRTRDADKLRADWIARLRERLASAHANVVTTAALAALTDPAPRARALALRFFYELGIEIASRSCRTVSATASFGTASEEQRVRWS